MKQRQSCHGFPALKRSGVRLYSARGEYGRIIRICRLCACKQSRNGSTYSPATVSWLTPISVAKACCELTAWQLVFVIWEWTRSSFARSEEHTSELQSLA